MENLRVFCKIVITSQFMRTQKIGGYVMGKKYKYCYEICNQADRTLLKNNALHWKKHS